jgi:general secretion pathway protein D
VTRRLFPKGVKARRCGRAWWRALTATMLLAIFPVVMEAQAVPPPTPSTPAQKESSAAAAPAKAEKEPGAGARRRALKLYLAASKLFAAGQFDAALREYQRAAALDPTKTDYRLAVDVARSHEVSALIVAAAKDRLSGNTAAATAALTRAMDLDPNNPEVAEHLYQLGDDALRKQPAPLYQQADNALGQAPPLLPAGDVRSFHLRAEQRQMIPEVFKAFGIDAMLDDSVQPTQVRFDMDDATFTQAARALGMTTHTFYVPLDAHHVLVARDTPENRRNFTRQELETVYLSGLTSQELTDVGNLARNVFNVAQMAADPSASTLTLRAPEANLDAFNTTMRSLLDGRNQVMLNVRLIQLAHTSTRNTGVQPPQTFSAINVYSEEQSILNANQSLVQQIISSGLASPGDTLAILGILLASGQVSSSLFSNGLALFGGGLTSSALSPGGPATLNLNLNSSDSHEIDDIQLRLGDGEAGALTEGEKYPIQTSSYSTLSGSVPNIPGLTGAGSSSSLSSLLSSLTSATPTIPMIQYQDLGLTLKVTPNVLRGDDVALTIDLKITALAGASLDGNPVLNNEAYSGVVTLKKGQTVELASILNRTESRAITGTPGISEIPGLNNISANDLQRNFSTLVIMITPDVVRGTQAAGHTPMMLVEKGSSVE